MYNPKDDPSKRLRIALGQIYRSIKKDTGAWPESVAILTTTGQGVARISAALNCEVKPVRHKVLFDEAVAMLSARLAAFLLEPKFEANKNADIAKCLELLAAVRLIGGTNTAINDANKYLKWSTNIIKGEKVRANLPQALEALIIMARTITLTGDPGKDWNQIKRMLRNSDLPEISRIASDLDYLIAFKRGKIIAANLLAMWMNEGAYTHAREALDSAIVQDQLQGGVDDLKGIHVMTIHKSKGKQFDGVIIVREGQRLGANEWRSSLVWRDDPIPHNRSRKILRVGITRARCRVLVLEPFYPPCPILSPHIL